MEVKLRGWKKTYLDLDRGDAAELGKERARRRGGGRSDRRGGDTGGTEGEEGRRRAINARNYNQRGAEGRFACLPWTITEFWC